MYLLLYNLIISLICWKSSEGFKFTIVHNNDMQARYDPIKGEGEKCPESDDELELCFGGFARVATAISEARAEGPTIYLNAGDTFQGTSWYTVYKGDLAAELLNYLRPDAVCLGNHELDDNVRGLIKFLDKVDFPVVCCNLNLEKVPQLQENPNLMGSTIIHKFEQKIGIIGYLTEEKKELVAINGIGYYPEIPSINAEAVKLRQQGVNIIIALGHSGYKMDQEIAKHCPEVDIVVGGHSHTFLYTGRPPHKELPDGNYPTIVTKPNGRNVPVVQAYAFTKYLGKLHVEFDKGGNLIYSRGAPILLDSTVVQNKSIVNLLNAKRSKITEIESKVVGITKVLLNGDSAICRQEECNLGNFICDALVYARVTQNLGGLYWTDASVALINAGSIRGTIDAGTVTAADLATILPFENTVSVTRIIGRDLMKALEHSFSLRHTTFDGGFLQVSGLRVAFDLNRPKGKRVASVQVLCADCKVPIYEPLDLLKYYHVVLPTFLLKGGDGHMYLRKAGTDQDIVMPWIDREIVAKYFEEHKLVYPIIEQRIIIEQRVHRSCGILINNNKLLISFISLVGVVLIKVL